MKDGYFDVYNCIPVETTSEQNEDNFKKIVPFKPNKPLFIKDFDEVRIEQYATKLQCKLDSSNST